MKKPGIQAPDLAVAGDAEKLVLFLHLYCSARHGDRERTPYRFTSPRLRLSVESAPPLCLPCARLLSHALVKRVLCPLDPKPKCRKCPDHCYLPAYRLEMEKVMRFSGPRSVFTHWED